MAHWTISVDWEPSLRREPGRGPSSRRLIATSDTDEVFAADATIEPVDLDVVLRDAPADRTWPAIVLLAALELENRIRGGERPSEGDVMPVPVAARQVRRWAHD